VFIEAKDDGGGGDNWTTGAISRAKLQSNHYHQQTNIQYTIYFIILWHDVVLALKMPLNTNQSTDLVDYFLQSLFLSLCVKLWVIFIIQLAWVSLLMLVAVASTARVLQKSWFICRQIRFIEWGWGLLLYIHVI